MLHTQPLLFIVFENATWTIDFCGFPYFNLAIDFKSKQESEQEFLITSTTKNDVDNFFRIT